MLLTIIAMAVIPSVVFFSLRSASVQTYLAGKAADYLSKELDATISVGGVNISLFLNIILEDVEVLDQNHSPLISSKRMILDIDRISPSKRMMVVNKIHFDQATVLVGKQKGEEDFNIKFLTDYFLQEERADTLKFPKWEVTVLSFEFSNAKLSLNDQNFQPTADGFDYNHFVFDHLDIEVKDILLDNNILEARIKNFSVEESKGFAISSLSAHLFISPSGSRLKDFLFKSNESLLSITIDAQYDGYHAFNNFIRDVELNVNINPSRIALYELGHFIPDLYGIEGKLALNGKVSGKVDNLRGKDIALQYGKLTQFNGNFNVVGLPNIDETFLTLSVEQLVTNKPDLESVKLPNSFEQTHIVLPEEVAKLGITSFSGNFTGFLYDFVAFGNFKTALGSISTDIAIVSKNDYKDITYTGNIATKGFALNRLVNDSENFGNVSLSTHIEGKGFNADNLNVRLTGQIHSIEFRNYNYQQLKVAGNFSNQMFNGSFVVDDPNIFLDFGGVIDYKEKTPELNFTAEVKNANLSKLNIYQRDSLFHSLLSTEIKVNGKGTSLANIEGEINAYSTSYEERLITNPDSIVQNIIQTDVIALENKITPGDDKDLRFYSDFLDVQIEGELHYDKLMGSLNHFFYTYAPSIFKNVPQEMEVVTQHAEYKIHFKNTLEITRVFAPFIQIAPHSFFNGHINTTGNEFSFGGSTHYLVLADNLLKDPEINIHSDSTHLEIVTRSDKLFLTDSIWMEQFFISGLISHDSISLHTQWENNGTDNKNLGSIRTQGHILSPNKAEFSILPSYAYINDSLWSIQPGNKILVDSSSIAVEGFHLYKKNEFLKVFGSLSDDPNDILNIKLNNFNLESLSYLLGDRKVDFSGIASGELELSNIRTTPTILTELLIKDFAFNKDLLGDLSLISQWDAKQKAFKIDSEVIYFGNVGSNKPIVASGYFYPEREKDNFDIDITIENLKMSIFGRYIEDFASNFRGLASGQLKLRGPLTAPELSGRARLVRTGFRVDYLNTAYSFAHEVVVEKNYFKFDNLMLNDTLGNSARVSGIVRHNNFYNFVVDINLYPEELVVLNTQPHHNELFYGTAFATGLARVHGPVNDIRINVAATSNRGTQIFLPLDYFGEIKESSFISFVSSNGNDDQEVIYKTPQNLGLSLNFDLTLTPEAEVQIIFDSQIGDIMRGRGFGDIKMEIDKQGSFFMYGDYTIQEGDYLFTLQNLINKRFRVEQGGTIRWKGDPYDADIDLRAIYRLRTSLFDLAANQSDTSDVYRRRVPIETVLHLEDKLFNPSISFEIQLPGSDESTREMIERLISTEQEMNRQVFSLLILNRFVPPEDGFNSALSYGMGSTSTELLSNQLSNWLSQISTDFDIGVNYRPGDEISSQEVELALSTQLFDDRVVIDGNVGVAGNHPAQTQRTSNIIGDVNVEVKITPEGKFRVKAFNRSNTFDLLNTNAPYTQGVGIFYRREFDNLSDLFRKQRRTVLEIPELEDAESSVAE